MTIPTIKTRKKGELQRKCSRIKQGNTTCYLPSCDFDFGVGSTETSCLQLAANYSNQKMPSALLACSHRLPHHSLLLCGGEFGQLNWNLVVL